VVDRLPSLRGIEAFVNAAETLSFRTAAERLNVTVSAVSHRIHTLEKEIGLRLFVRSGRALTLTAGGVDYRDRLLPLVGQLQQASHAVHDASKSQSVRIASFQLFHAHWLAPRIGRFVDINPKADIELLTLRRRKMIHPDITIRILRLGEVGADDELLFDWNVAPICKIELVDHYGLRTPADLTRAILIQTSSALDVWPLWFAAAGLPEGMPHRSIFADSPSLNVDLVALGIGVGITADFLAEQSRQQGLLVQPFATTYRYPGGVFINRATSQERPAVAEFREWLTKEAASTIEKISTWRESNSLSAAQ
jgi:DNA-binding transcriptional LysR family regulator